jgi:hypothetical protein
MLCKGKGPAWGLLPWPGGAAHLGVAPVKSTSCARSLAFSFLMWPNNAQRQDGVVGVCAFRVFRRSSISRSIHLRCADCKHGLIVKVGTDGAKRINHIPAVLSASADLDGALDGYGAPIGFESCASPRPDVFEASSVERPIIGDDQELPMIHPASNFPRNVGSSDDKPRLRQNASLRGSDDCCRLADRRYRSRRGSGRTLRTCSA